MRIAEINRKTAETDIKITLDLDGAGTSVCDTGCGFWITCSPCLPVMAE